MRHFYWELRLLMRNRAFVLLIGIYAAAACLAIIAGDQRRDQQILQQAQQEARYQEELSKWRAQGEQIDPGYLGYYQFLTTSAKRSPWAALFSNEQAEHNWNLRVRLLALYGQLYAGEIQHYDNWILGRFDLGFVWIYLLPIVIGLLCVNAIADEKISGRWALLRGQSKSTRHFLINRLTVHFVVVTALNVGLLLFASAVLRIPVDGSWRLILSLLLVYQMFWFSLAGLIAYTEKNATFNVLSYCSIWLLAALLLPGLHYLNNLNSEEMDLGIAVLMGQREQMNDSWDRDKKADFARFLQQNPQWAETGPLSEAFHWKWYYAMQRMSDSAVQEQVDRLKQLRLEAYGSARHWAWASPVMSLQQSLGAIAGTDGPAHQYYLDQVKKLHEGLQTFLYSHYFFETPFPQEKLDTMPTLAGAEKPTNSGLGILQILALTALLFALMPLIRAGSQTKTNVKPLAGKRGGAGSQAVTTADSLAVSEH